MKINEFEGKYRFLSNFYPCEVFFDGEKYPSTEHAYQAAKTFDHTIRRIIKGMATPGEAKRYVKKIKVRWDWDKFKLSIMEDLLRQKFSQPYFYERLKETGDAELIEGNQWNDTFWGVCNGVGKNHLGKILMKIRDENVIRCLF